MRHALSGRSNLRAQNSLFLLFRTARSLFVGCALVGMATAPAQAQQLARVRTSEVYGATKPISGWTKFCARYPDECAVNTTEPDNVELTENVWALIMSTNRKVNKRIKAITDQEHWGVVDSWDFPTDGKGDCEDFQLLKRKLLVDSGLPRRAMRMTVVIDEDGEGHAVMMVRTTRGDFVLDNKFDAVLTWDKTPYVYVKRESQAGVGWVSLGGIASPTATANR
jgi:predicted transglutaminase-like cysteine proteinase